MTEKIQTVTVFAVDVIGYSQKPLKDQKQAQDILDRSLETASNKTLNTDNDPRWIDAGDGGFFLISGDDLAVLEVLAHFCGLVDYETRQWSDDSKIHQRYAIHQDKTMYWNGKLGPKFTGPALNNCARLLSSMNKEQKGQVICSNEFYKIIKETEEPSVKARRLTDYEDKHGIKHPRYNLLRDPVFGVEPLQRELHDSPFSRKK